MEAERIVGAAEFKTRCLELFDHLASGRLKRVVVTRRGKPVAVLTPPEDSEPESLHGFLRGSVTIPSGFDLTEPIVAEPFAAEEGLVHE